MHLGRNVYNFQVKCIGYDQYKDINQQLTFQQDLSNGFGNLMTRLESILTCNVFICQQPSSLNALSIPENRDNLPERSADIVRSMQTINNKMHRFSMWKDVENNRILGVNLKTRAYRDLRSIYKNTRSVWVVLIKIE